MICRNCKFSLIGSEKFCPNCGAPLSEISEEKSETEVLTPPEAPKIFFTPVKQEGESYERSEIFRTQDTTAEKEPPKKKSSSQKSSSKAPVMLMLVLILAVLVMGLFIAAEHFDVAPAILQYLEKEPEETTASAPLTTADDTAPSDFVKDSGVLEPDLSYAPTQAYVANSKTLSLRKGPADSYGLIKNLESGCQLQILGGTDLDDRWIYVYVPFYDCYGWLNAAFITLYSNIETTADTTDSTERDVTEFQEQTTLAEDAETTLVSH